jgi:enoyl-CoA hydratase/carnithine racemase
MNAPVLYESHDRVAVITINRPEKRNAINAAVVEELVGAWRRLNNGEDRVAVLTATGDDCFTVGADLRV